MPYTITWTETTTHEVTLSAAELAALKGVSVDELDRIQRPQLADGLADALAELDAGFIGLERDQIEVRSC